VLGLVEISKEYVNISGFTITNNGNNTSSKGIRINSNNNISNRD